MRAWRVSSPRVIVAIVAVVIVAGTAAFLFWRRDSAERPPEALNNVAGNYRVCLATSSDQSKSLASEVWTVLQARAANGSLNAQRFPVPKDKRATVAYLNGLVSSGCNVIVVADKSLIEAIADPAKSAPNQKFLMVGEPDSGLTGNVEVAKDPATVDSWISQHAAAR